MTLIIKKSFKRQERKNMAILVDTNVILDVLLKREPYVKGYAII